MRHGFFAVTLFAAMFLGACNSDRDIIGSYIGGDESAKMMFRISEVQRQKITGEFTFVSVGDDGKVQAATRPLSGTIDSDVVYLAVERGDGLSLINGVLRENSLELTFFSDGSSSKMTFDRSDPKEFVTAINDARRRAAEMVQAKEGEVVRQADLRQLSADQDQINAFASDLAAKAGNVADSVARIESIVTDYSQMSNPNAAARHQWVREALQTLSEAEPRHEERASVIFEMCNTDHRLNCDRVKSGLALYRSKSALLRAAADHEQATYTRLYQRAST